MSEQNHQSPLAVAYAQALLELANESNQTNALAGELVDLRDILKTTPMLKDVLADPAISSDEHAKLITDAFEGRVSQLLFNFLRLLNAKGRLKSLGSIIDAFESLLDAQNGKIEVDVTVAQCLNDSELKAVHERISKALNRDAIVHQYVDDSIVGGIILRVQDQLIDASVKTQLDTLRKQLATRPR